MPAPHAPAPHAMPAQGGRPSGDGPPDGPDAEAVGTGRAVEGRITIEDEVIEKIAAIAALEVAGVVALTGRPGPGPGPAPGPVSAQGAAQGAEPLRRPEPAAGGVRIRLHDDEVTLDLGIAVEYGSVIMDVATVVKANVARVAGLMLGMRVAAVNVAVEDVRMPGPRSR
ncbi:Asp23/Gls24 family envelope stress response protein [Actinomadura fibrosa]|uniref:Asp23/Gls24 family envelope stress response protein n=1 Tax=Actinomadura fibrosa TaxID=111802 RepID=UPI001A954E4E|nr:Asp23/Gls24 family envelope stress response protein [Actinomadura fibrosa]